MRTYNLKPLSQKCGKGLFFYLKYETMPCRDWDDDAQARYDSDKRRECEKLLKEREAMLCAIFTELEKDLDPVDMREFLESAEVHGQCNIKDFWLEHKKEDELRLRKDLSKYSKHEIELLRKILIENEL